MKKTWIILLSAFIFSCNNDEKKDGDTSSATTNNTAAPDTSSVTTGSTLPAGITQADYDKGLSLVAGSDCLTCHQINQKLTGPAYADIANKYEPTKENITMLANKIIKGGTGVWGQVPMLPHDGLSQEDAEAMVKYVLSLKNHK
jgi:cytochrome c